MVRKLNECFENHTPPPADEMHLPKLQNTASHPIGCHLYALLKGAQQHQLGTQASDLSQNVVLLLINIRSWESQGNLMGECLMQTLGHEISPCMPPVTFLIAAEYMQI